MISTYFEIAVCYYLFAVNTSVGPALTFSCESFLTQLRTGRRQKQIAKHVQNLEKLIFVGPIPSKRDTQKSSATDINGVVSSFDY